MIAAGAPWGVGRRASTALHRGPPLPTLAMPHAFSQHRKRLRPSLAWTSPWSSPTTTSPSSSTRRGGAPGTLYVIDAATSAEEETATSDAEGRGGVMLAIRQKEETHVARWLPLGAGVLFALTFARELPALRRYLKLRSM